MIQNDKVLAEKFVQFFMHTNRWLTQRMEAQMANNNSELTAHQIRTLFLIYKKQPCTASDLSNQAHVKLATMSYMLGKLQKQGLITRVQGQEDRRVVLVRLTDQGKSVLDLSMEICLTDIAEMLSVLSKSDKEILYKSIVEIHGVVLQLLSNRRESYEE